MNTKFIWNSVRLNKKFTGVIRLKLKRLDLLSRICKVSSKSLRLFRNIFKKFKFHLIVFEHDKEKQKNVRDGICELDQSQT